MNTQKVGKLWVVDCNGTPRSGKGTITTGLAKSTPGATLEETGADYRSVTFCLLKDRKIGKTSTEARVSEVVGNLTEDEIISYVGKRQDIIAKHGLDALYTADVSSQVGRVGQQANVRSAVKQSLRNRVRQYIADPHTHLLFLDGRNLTNVIEDIEGLDRLVRIFVDCQPFVAAKREAYRQKIDITDPKNDAIYRSILQNIRERQQADETRELDPVHPEDTSINYWFNASVQYETAEHLAEERGISFAAAADMTASRHDFRTGGRHGAGAKAVAEDRQIYFDTTETSKNDMLVFAQRIIDEALAQKSGRYQARSEHLIAR